MTTVSQSYEVLKPTYREHLMLLCRDRTEYDQAAVKYLNEGLKDGQLCLYASVLNGEEEHLDKIAIRIPDYHDRVQNGDLVVLDFKPFHQSAQESDLAMFIELGKKIESLLNARVVEGKGDKVLIFAEAAGALSENGDFEESVSLERWWHDLFAEWKARKLNVTLVCPHPIAMFHDEISLGIKERIAQEHTLALDIEELKKKSSSRPRILVVEPEQDIRAVYDLYFKALGDIASVRLVGDQDSYMNQVLSVTDEGYDLLIIDANLEDNDKRLYALESVRLIKQMIPNQRIVLTTTSLEGARIAESLGVAERVLVKPFSLSTLQSLISRRT